VLYSAQTWLAFAIATKYFRDLHYAWCTPYFNGGAPSTLMPGANPPSSTPNDIARTLKEDIARGDGHSAKIDENRSGLRRGARAKHTKGIITDQEFKDIGSIIEAASFNDFRPLIYVIPVERVKTLVIDPPLADKANPFSEEYLIVELPRSSFDVFEVT
jgi:hypothetical protein